MSAAAARVTRGSAPSCPIRGVGLSMEAWARSCSSLGRGGASVSCPMWALSCEFPAVPWALMGMPPSDALVIPENDWRAEPAQFQQWDRAMRSLDDEPRWLVVRAEDDRGTLDQTAREILTRYQRLVPRTNGASSGPEFARVLSGHRALHDLSLPLVKADYDHALDAWQWVLRLAPNVGLAVQLAALFHDVERLLSEAERRVEHTAADYQAFKNAHAEQGASLAVEVLAACGIEARVCAAVGQLIRQHELPSEPARSSELSLLADADALSFFSLNSPGFADYYGPEHTLKKVRYSLGRMSSSAVRRLAGIRLREDIAGYLAEAARVEATEALGQVRP